MTPFDFSLFAENLDYGVIRIVIIIVISKTFIIRFIEPFLSVQLILLSVYIILFNSN